VIEGDTYLVNGVASPSSFATIDDALTAIASSPSLSGTILVDGLIFTPASPASAPTLNISNSVRITSVSPAIPAVISNAATTGPIHVLRIEAFPDNLTVVIDNI
jgi:hypothetical protein